SLTVGLKYGVDISNQKARQFNKKDIDDIDVIYVMDANNYCDVIAMAHTQDARANIQLIMDELPVLANTSVPDPYWGPATDFEHIFQLLDKVCSEIAKKLL